MTNNNILETSFQNFIGNETSNTQIPYGQFIITGQNHFEFGNNIRGTTVPAGTENMTDTSYYLNSQPIFWTNNINWPPIGYPNSLGQNINPAKQRFISGEILTICDDSLIIALPEKKEFGKLIIWPNPSKQKVFFKSSANEIHKITLSDISGRKALIKEIYPINNIVTIDLTTITKNGIYIVNVKSNNEIKTAKILILKNEN